ncbi:MAG: nitroreductase family protein [Victivallales bacterium]
MNLSNAIKNRRSIRRYKQKPVDEKLLIELIDSARLAPSGGNMQQIRYVIVKTPEIVKKIFSLTGWGGHVRPKRSPEWGKDAPLAFIAVIASAENVAGRKIVYADAGAAIQNMLLKAVELGLGTCWIGNFKEENVSPILGLTPEMKTMYLVAVGYPDETPVQEDIDTGTPTKYFLDDKDVIHVPKFKVDAITILK